MKFKFQLSQKKPLKMAEGISSLPLALEPVMVNIVEMEEGSEVPEHSHPQEQISLILEGELEFELEGEKFLLKAGEGVLIPKNASHRAKARKKTLAYDIFSPPRWDYLEKLKK